MEGRTENLHGIAIPKKSRSLDLKSLYHLKVPKETHKKNLKRKGNSHEDGDQKTNQKKKIRKEMSLSSLENADGNTKKAVEEECCIGPSSDGKDSCELHSGLSQRLSGGNGINRVSLSLGDNAVHIPKRKRGLVRRKKFETVQGQNLSEQTSSKSGHGDQMPELIRDDLGQGVESPMLKQKDIDEFKESMSSDSNSVQRFKGNEDSTLYAVVNSGDSKKISRKRDRKRKILAPDSVPVEAGTVIKSSKLSGNLKEDDEDNLEENAARMLSSRFDPRCTGFSSSSNSSMLPSENGISISPSPGRNRGNHGSKSLSGSESPSVDAAGRILRPRKQHKEKGSARKRRHFYEIFLDDLDAYWVLNQRIKVFWPLDQSWYYGTVNDYDKSKKLHHIKYDDRDEEWINLQTERFKLLLLPSEVPGNAGCKRSAMKINSVQKKGSKSRKERQGKLITEDDSCGGSFMDSEPIISWLARSSDQAKSSFNGVKKQKTSTTPLKSASSLLYEENGVQGVPKSSLRGGKSNPFCDSVFLDKLGDNFIEKLSSENATCSKDGKMPIVYFRRRFRRLNSISPHVSEGVPVIISAPGSIFFNPLVGRLSDVNEPDNKNFDADGPLCFTYNVGGVSEIRFLDLESAALKIDINLPIRSVLNYDLESLWLLHAVLLLQNGAVMTKWPRVHLEILFIDNEVGLWFLLFEGCLNMAAAFVFMILRVFLESPEQGKDVDVQLPVTSIRFRFSGVDDVKRQVVFAFYNFSSLQSSKWMYLDSKLKRYCLLSKRLHISECTYDNIQALQNGLRECPITTISGKPSSFKVMPKRTRMRANFMGISTDFTPVEASQSSVAGKRKHPLFALSFSAAPTFFLSLHLKLLMDRSVNHLSFCDHSSVGDQENGYSTIDDCSHSNAEINLKKDMMTLSIGVASDGWACAEPNLIISPSVCSDQIASHNCQNIDLSAGGISGSPSSERLSPIHLHEWQSHNSELELCSLPSSSLVDKDKADDIPHSFMGDLNVQIPSVDQIRKPANGDMQIAHDSSDSSWNANECVTPSPKSTAPRSSCHRNRNSSSSFGFLSHGWSGGNDSFHNGFSNGPKKPRTQVSYSLPLAGYDFSSKHRSPNQKGFHQKRIRKANEKKSSDVARGPKKDLDSLYCDANVLITVGDKGQRESGAQVVLELFDHNEWKLSVKFSGITRYSYKAHQFLQPGSTNRYTHAMMWKGGKDWTLEFTDRSHWALFKEMHEECHNRNLRAALVKNIPIPGVCLIEENHEDGPEVAFVRGSKYFQQVETDVEMALNPSQVLYDMDSEDEQWISNIQKSEKGNSSLEGISQMFEKIMDMFEKAAYSRQCDQFTPNEIEEITSDVGPLCLAKTIYGHWQQRRKQKGMALVRHFQPPLWERYQQELREWEVAMNKNNNPPSYGCLDKVAALEKPPMFAFCLKPRGLEVPNKGSKHRAQKRYSVSGHINSILGEHDGFHNFGRRMNGFVFSDEKLTYLGHNYDSLDDSPLSLTSPRVFSPRDSGSMGYFAPSNDGYDRNRVPKLYRSKSKKSGTFIHHDDPQMISYHSHRMPGKRSGVGNWNLSHDWPGHGQYKLDGSYRHGVEQFDGSDLDEYKLHDASGAAQHALNVAKLKRERARRLLYRADLAIHKAVAALMTAEAMKASEDSNSDR